MWGAIIGGIVSLYTNYRARRQSNEATQAGLAQEQEANRAKQASIAEARAAQAPALGYFNTVVAQGSRLNPAQRQYVADTREQTGQLLSSRLGGRAATAIASRAALDVGNATTQANQARADQAATLLANPANTNLILAAGNARAADAEAAARATREIGATNAGATLASGQLIGQGIGQYFANQGNEDLLSAIRANSVRTSAYPSSSSTHGGYNNAPLYPVDNYA